MYASEKQPLSAIGRQTSFHGPEVELSVVEADVDNTIIYLHKQTLSTLHMQSSDLAVLTGPRRETLVNVTHDDQYGVSPGSVRMSTFLRKQVFSAPHRGSDTVTVTPWQEPGNELVCEKLLVQPVGESLQEHGITGIDLYRPYLKPYFSIERPVNKGDFILAYKDDNEKQAVEFRVVAASPHMGIVKPKISKVYYEPDPVWRDPSKGPPRGCCVVL